MQATFPIIVGSRRSGTTLLRAIFDSHSKVAVANEAHFIVPMARQIRKYEREGRLERSAFMEHLTRDSGWSRLKLGRDSVEAAIDEETSFVDAVRRVFLLYAKAQGKSMYGEKTPSYVKHIQLLADLFPEARFLHMVRDGRDVSASTLEAPFGPTTMTEAAWAWREAVVRGRRQGKPLGTSRYHEIRYEELVANPIDVVKRASNFAGIEFEDQMLDYHRRATELLTFTGRPGSHKRLGEPPSKNREWRTQMKPADLMAFEAIAGRTLEEFGYSRAYPESAFKQAVSAASSGVRWKLKRIRYARRRARKLSR